MTNNAKIVSHFLAVCLESTGFQPQSGGLVDAEHEVHVLDSLADGALQQVVDAGGDEQLLTVLLDMYQRLVSVHHLFQVNGLVAVVGEGGILVEVLVGLDDVLYRGGCLDDGRTEDAAGEVATIGDEVDVGIEIALHLLQRLTNLGDVLVLEGLVDAQVGHAPREVGSGTWLLAGTRRACDGVDGNVVLEQVQVSCRQQSNLDGGGEAAGIGHMLCLHNLFLIYFWQAIDIVMIALDAEVLCQVDNLHVGGDGVLAEESLTLAVSEAEEDDVDLLERHLVGKPQIGIANESLVYVADEIASVTLGVGKHNLCLWMVQQQSDEFSTSIACRT